MGVERVAKLSLEHISALLPRLERYGAYGLHTHSLLRLLLRRVNTTPFEIFAAGGDAPDAAVVAVTRDSPQQVTLNVCAREDPASQRRLEGLLRAPQLRGLWRTSLRAESISTGLAPVLATVAADHGVRVSFWNERRLFARHPSLPCMTGAVPRAGVTVGPLQARQVTRLRRQWRAVDRAALEPVDGRLTAGVFLPAESRDSPAAWALISRQGVLRFGEAQQTESDGALQRLAVAELTRLCQHLDLPCISNVPDTDLGAFRDLMRLDFITAHSVMSADFAPEVSEAQGVGENIDTEERAVMVHGL